MTGTAFCEDTTMATEAEDVGGMVRWEETTIMGLEEEETAFCEDRTTTAAEVVALAVVVVLGLWEVVAFLVAEVQGVVALWRRLEVTTTLEEVLGLWVVEDFLELEEDLQGVVVGFLEVEDTQGVVVFLVEVVQGVGVGFLEVVQGVVVGFLEVEQGVVVGFLEVEQGVVVGFLGVVQGVVVDFLDVEQGVVVGFLDVEQGVVVGFLDVEQGVVEGFLDVEQGVVVGFLEVEHGVVVGFFDVVQGVVVGFLEVEHGVGLCFLVEVVQGVVVEVVVQGWVTVTTFVLQVQVGRPGPGTKTRDTVVSKMVCGSRGTAGKSGCDGCQPPGRVEVSIWDWASPERTATATAVTLMMSERGGKVGNERKW